jgi:hypothetical protein
MIDAQKRLIAIDIEVKTSKIMDLCLDSLYAFKYPILPFNTIQIAF